MKIASIDCGTNSFHLMIGQISAQGQVEVIEEFQLQIEHTLARHGAERLWKLLKSEPFVASLGAMTGNMAVQQNLSAQLDAVGKEVLRRAGSLRAG